MQGIRWTWLCIPLVAAPLLAPSPLFGAATPPPPPPPPLGATVPGNVCNPPPLPPGMATPKGSVGFLAYASVDQKGTVNTGCGTLLLGHNVTSVKRTGTGIYDVKLATAFPAPVCVVSATPGGANWPICQSFVANSSGQIAVFCYGFDATKGQFVQADQSFNIQCMAPQ